MSAHWGPQACEACGRATRSLQEGSQALGVWCCHTCALEAHARAVEVGSEQAREELDERRRVRLEVQDAT